MLDNGAAPRVTAPIPPSEIIVVPRLGADRAGTPEVTRRREVGVSPLVTGDHTPRLGVNDIPFPHAQPLIVARDMVAALAAAGYFQTL